MTLIHVSAEAAVSFTPCLTAMANFCARCQYLPYGCASKCIRSLSKPRNPRYGDLSLHQLHKAFQHIYIIPLVFACTLSNTIKNTRGECQSKPNTSDPESLGLIMCLVMIINTFSWFELTCCFSWQTAMTITHLSGYALNCEEQKG